MANVPPADPHTDDAHHVGGGHDHEHETVHDDHVDDAEPLGPLDGRAWAAAIGGGLLGLMVAGAFYLALTA